MADVRKVRDVMSEGVVTLDPNDRLIRPDGLSKERRIRHYPVVDEEGSLVGVVSQRDMFHSGLLKAIGYGTRGLESLFEDLFVKEVMITEVITTTPDSPVGEAARVMLDRKIGCLPVVDDRGAVVGIVTETDLVALVAKG